MHLPGGQRQLTTLTIRVMIMEARNVHGYQLHSDGKASHLSAAERSRSDIDNHKAKAGMSVTKERRNMCTGTSNSLKATAAR